MMRVLKGTSVIKDRVLVFKFALPGLILGLLQQALHILLLNFSHSIGYRLWTGFKFFCVRRFQIFRLSFNYKTHIVQYV